MPERYWFPAKRWGWGWGFPCTWQGWVVLAGYFAVMATLPHLLPPGHAPVAFAVAAAGVTLALLLICFLKGEPIGRRKL